MERERSTEVLGVSAVLLLGLILRLLPARNSLVDGQVLFYGYDTFYHMRRILYSVENFPQTLWFDSYLNHPHGMGLTWPPLFDLTMAAASLLLGGSSRAVDMTAALAAPILGTMMIAVLYLLAKKLFGMEVALLSAFLLAIDTRHIGRTTFGFPDHDTMELLFILGAILLLAYALTEGHRWLRFALPAGVLLAATAYTWLGTPAYLGAIVAFGVVQIAMDLKEGRSSQETILPLAAAFGVALLLILPFWDQPWLIPSFFGAAGSLAFLGFLGVLSRIFSSKGIPWIFFLPIVALFGYVAFILSYATVMTQDARSYFWAGFNFFFGSDLARLGIQEAMPVFKVYSLFSLPGLGLLSALGGLLILISTVHRFGFRRDMTLFLVWALFSSALMISQSRFLFLFSLSGSVLIALLFFWGRDKIRSSDRFKNVDSRASKVWIGILLLVLILPSGLNISDITVYRPEISGDWHQTLAWVREETPPTVGYDNPVLAGDYGVLSWWDYGNWILYQSRRPVVANNFQAGAIEAAGFFLSESEKNALKIADDRDVRYVITSDKMVYGKLPAIARWIEEDPSSYVLIRPERDIVNYDHSKRFLGTTLARLHLLDCSGLGHFRLIHESETSRGLVFPVREVKVFEKVAGARITGTTPHDKPMGLILEMRSNEGRRFQYYNSVMAVDGRYEIVVPYSTEEMAGVSSIGPYLLGPVLDVAGGESKEVDVRERDVLEGRTIIVDF
ncbi:STT3 domain-containing protein [Candidatus Methanocrinis natronophilus]|uniref:dolichyl-phosphooligosaccharide-protein glycotransferase n=1 Tax=Candidatus Methanocrinis natronophilus TaxID=3033396 RepID=A0ABT5X8Y3_9EURY|nr:STT3 domain-containing protein [Candidatus Methanocrinis natronophilus]MDF0591165.1 STT3 domain-containing protein [Candidatus Methanocrinis natronophilus]